MELGTQENNFDRALPDQQTALTSGCVNTPEQHWRILGTETSQTQTTQFEEIEQMLMSLEKLKSHQEIYEVVELSIRWKSGG